MIKHYLQVAWRSLFRKKAYAFTTLTGLSLGLTSCILILLFVIDELSFDQYHIRKDRIYRLATTMEGSEFEGIAKVNGPWGPAAAQTIPEIESMARIVMTGQLLVENGPLRLYEPNGFYADSTLFQIFSYAMVEGDARKALTGLNTMVVTKSFARKYFGETSALGKTLRIDGQTDYQVTGIIEDVPSASHFTFDYLLSMRSLQHPQRDSWTQWNQFYTYFLVREGADPNSIPAKMKSIIDRNMDKETSARYNPFLQHLTGIHLHSHLHREINPNSDVMYIYIFSSIALLILMISCVNFVNMTTAIASVRSKEIGVRKVNGAAHKQLVIQFMAEVFLVCVMSMMIALMLTLVALPVLNDLTGKNIQTEYLFRPAIAIAILAVTLLTGVLAGSYPALYQASLKPMQVLKGRWTPSGSSGLRKALVVFQFALSSLLVIASVVIFQQLHFLRNKSLGFDPHQVLTIPIQSNTLRENHETVRNELLKFPGVLTVSLSGNIPGGGDWGIPTVPEGFSSENTPPIRIMAVDDQFLKTYGIEVIQGRDFSRDFASDSGAYVINEEAAKQLGWTDPLSKTFSMPAVGRGPGRVVGVVKDFHFRSIREKIGPLLFFMPPREWYAIYSIKIDAARSDETLEFIEQQWSRFDPDHPFTYSFLDDRFQLLYQQERRLATIIGYFTGIGIFLACLGLYSLASYTIQQRVKEIGIRKVIGASTQQIVTLLSKQYLLLVVIGFALGTPVSLYVLQQWLDSFAYHVSFNFLLVGACGLVSIAIALLTVGLRALRAASSNPADSLRSE